MTTVLITGANRGLGLEFARQYQAEGADVIACCRHPAEADSLKQLGVRVMELDVGDLASIAALAGILKDVAIDILVSNAGIWGPQAQSADGCDPEAVMETLRVNAVAPLRLAQAFKPNLKAGHDKKLAVLTSKMGSISDSSGGEIAYRASKAALNMIMHVAAKDWTRDGILVGIFHPGWVRTDMGGPSAPLDAKTSVTGLRARIAELSPQTSGRFLDYAGTEIRW
jgi:Dehydrogenases with different specificities (related to short-chain alcohol dehydrogenases)